MQSNTVKDILPHHIPALLMTSYTRTARHTYEKLLLDDLFFLFLKTTPHSNKKKQKTITTTKPQQQKQQQKTLIFPIEATPKYFLLQASYGCSTNIDATEVLYCFVFELVYA